jgi:hypothetical protein
MRGLAPIFLVLALAGPAGSVTTSGLRGVAREPVPVCLQDDPCDGATAGVTIVFSQNGRIVKRVTSGLQGHYRVTLAPGTYSVSAPSAMPRGRVLPARVSVYKARYRQVDFFVDSGIRSP